MAFTYKIVNDYRAGIPQTPTGTVGPFLMVALHDTEGGVGVPGALGTIQFLIDRADRNASYHEIWAWTESTKTFTAFRIVRTTSAAHSVNPVPPPGGSYEPDAIVRAALGARVNDPNRVIYAVSIAGKVGDVNRWSTDADFVAACKRRLAEIKTELGVSKMGEHFRINPSTRTDWGKMLTPALTGTGVQDMPELARYALETIRIDANAAIRDADGNLFFMTGSTSTAVRVGTTSDNRSVYWLAAKNTWAYTAAVNVLSVEPYVGGTVEVPTGITQAQLDAAIAAALTEGKALGVKAEKSRLRTLLGL